MYAARSSPHAPRAAHHPCAARRTEFRSGNQAQANRGHAVTGLGLPIARESARLLGGDLLLERSSDGGCTFVCIVPERASAVVASHSASLPAKRVEDDSVQLAPSEPHLLIIEDDSVMAEQLVEIVHARRLKAVVVGTGQEGLRLVYRQRSALHP